MRSARYYLITCVALFGVFFTLLFLDPINVSAVAKQSTISISVSSGTLSAQILPTSDGVFSESNVGTVSVGTDNFTGYNLRFVTSGSSSLVNAGSDEIESIESPITQSLFSSDSTYNNKWGLRPSQYVSESGGIETVISNSDYLPAPSASGLLLARTSAANLVNNNQVVPDVYSISFGARVDISLPAGVYQGTYTLVAVPNSIVYNVTYDSNTTDTVTNMPSPNPQAAVIDGGTSVEDSYVTLSDAVPIRNDKKFAGWCDSMTSTDSSTGDDICSGTLYQTEDELPVDQTAGPNITLYAVWVDTLFPIVWNQMDACTFNGATNGNITGTGCERYHNVRFIDTEIPLKRISIKIMRFILRLTITYLVNK